MIDTTETLSRLGDGMNAMGQHVQLSLELSKRDRRKNLLIILYSHILSLFQSVLQDVDKKRLDDACARLPDIIDSAFATAAVVKDPLVVGCFFDKDDVQQIYRRKAYQTLPRDISGRIRYLSGQHLAQQAGMSDYFTAIYRIVWGNEEAIRDDPQRAPFRVDDHQRAHGALPHSLGGLLHGFQRFRHVYCLGTVASDGHRRSSGL